MVIRAWFFLSQVCRRTGDPNKLMYCKRCDGAYHCYCQQPPHKVCVTADFQIMVTFLLLECWLKDHTCRMLAVGLTCAQNIQDVIAVVPMSLVVVLAQGELLNSIWCYLIDIQFDVVFCS